MGDLTINAAKCSSPFYSSIDPGEMKGC